MSPFPSSAREFESSYVGREVASHEGESEREREARLDVRVGVVLTMLLVVPLLAAPADRRVPGLAALVSQSFGLVLAAMLLWNARLVGRRTMLRRLVKTGAHLPVALFLFWAALSCALSPHKLLGVQEFLRLGAGVALYFAVVSAFKRSAQLSTLVGALLGLCAIIAVWGMAQHQAWGEDRAGGAFGNPQLLGSFLMLMLPFVVAVAREDGLPMRRLGAQAVALLMLGALFLTLARSAWISTTVALGVLAFLFWRLQPKKARVQTPLVARKHQFVWPLMVATILVVFAGLVASQSDGLSERIGARAATFGRLSNDVSLQGRFGQLWKAGTRMTAMKPLAGWGIGTFPAYQYWFSKHGAPIHSNGQGVRVSLAEQAHNVYLQTSAELGLVGALLFAAVPVSFLLRARKRLFEMETGLRRTLLMASMSATVGFMLDALFSPSWQYGQVSLFFWLVLGVGVACLRPREVRRPVLERTPKRRAVWAARLAAVGAFLFFAPLLPTAYASPTPFHHNGIHNQIGAKVGRVTFGTAFVQQFADVMLKRGGDA